MITPQSLRAARGLLNWGVRDLGKAAGVAWTTVSQFENGRSLRKSTADKLVKAVACQGRGTDRGEDMTGAVLKTPKG
ncbi:MAG: helix-turn-helix transcriptional regulator [Asticcacaulis sp.]